MRKESYTFRSGEILLIDKPKGWTSFDVVNKIRWEINHGIKKGEGRMKVGHAGTLDPLATGLLVIATGKFTKRLQEFQDQEKEYTGTINISGNTPSYDAETEVCETFTFDHITPNQLNIELEKLTGTIQQIPPVYSAIHVDGQRAYKAARNNKEVEIPARTVQVDAFEINRMELPELDFRIACSKGTYIRSLAFDLGKGLGTGGYLSALRRTKIGDFDVANAVDIEEMVEIIRDLKHRGVNESF